MFEFKFIGIVASLLFSDPITETQAKVDEINAKPMPAIQSIPDFQNNVVAQYVSGKNRNPFHGKSLHREMISYKPVKVVLDFDRKKQELEVYPMNRLVMTGVLKKGKSFDAMVRTPEGKLVVVSIGDYMGENHGRIKQITPEGMEIAEAIDDANGGYVERIRHLAVMENHKVEGI